MELEDEKLIKKDIIPYLPTQLRDILFKLRSGDFQNMEEIRLRTGKPLILRIKDMDFTIDKNGRLMSELNQKCYIVKQDDIFRTIASISDNSLYAFEEEIKRGFITIPGGHRVGLAGQIILGACEVRTIKDFSGIAFRIAREIKGCASELLPFIYDEKGKPLNSLFISAPRCGKTTFLRDVARLLSYGSEKYKASNVVVIDERSELAGSYQGRAQLDLGPRTDILDACPKALGMIMAIRSLSPQVIVTDEIGREEDIKAIEECINAGVVIISSVHASNIDEVSRKPLLRDLLASRVFKNLIVLSRRKGPATIEEKVRWE